MLLNINPSHSSTFPVHIYCPHHSASANSGTLPPIYETHLVFLIAASLSLIFTFVDDTDRRLSSSYNYWSVFGRRQACTKDCLSYPVASLLLQ